MAKKAIYSPETRERTLTALDRNRGNVYRTARQMGVSRDTVLRWAREEHPQPEAEETPMDKRLEEIAEKIVKIMPEKVEGASLQELSRVLPVVLSTLKEMQSSKEDDGVDVRQKLADLLSDLARRSEAIGDFGSSDGRTSA